MTGPGRGAILTAFLVAAMCALPAAAGAASPFREVVAYTEGQLESDGVRYALIVNRRGFPPFGAPLVFDTLRGRRFHPAAPSPGCSYGGIGGGLALWSCPPPRRTMITNLATGRSREPAGIEQVYTRSGGYSSCGAGEIGRHWLGISCGSHEDGFYLNHRTGRIADLSGVFGRPPPYPFFDMNYEGLVRYSCRPLDGHSSTPFPPPFGLEIGELNDPDSGILRLRRCDPERRETLSRCRFALCVTPQLGSRYVTWGEHELVLAYLPTIRRRVPIGRAPGLDAYSPVGTVAHTCTRVFAKWSYSVYVARFEPRHGAPPCQAHR